MSEVEKTGDTRSDVVEDGFNKLVVKCKYCGSKMLDKKLGKYILQEVIRISIFVFHHCNIAVVCTYGMTA